MVQKGSCEHFVGAVPGYRVQVKSTKSRGLRDLVALTYPLQGHDESYRFDGKVYVLR
jgi:hypothetical protein